MREERRALVTGGARRIGRAIVDSLSSSGWAVGVHYKNSKQEAIDCAEHLMNSDKKAVALYCDLSKPEQVDKLINQTSDFLGGPVNLLVNSASNFQEDLAQNFDQDGWDAHFEPNLRAPVTLARDMASQIPEGKQGLVINIIDQRVMALKPNLFTYTLSKAALWTATQTLAQALAPNVRVVAISPGPTMPNIYMTDADFHAKKLRTLTQRGTSLDEIVKAIDYIISADSLTGSMIMADGGQHLVRQ